MPVDPQLLERLKKKLGVERRQVDNRISERARTLMLPREQAAVALALQLGINVSRYATADDLAAIRGAAQQAPPPIPTAAPVERRATRRTGNRTRASPTPRRPRRARTKKVFVVYGRDSKARRALFAFLLSIGLEPIEWNKALRATGKGTPQIGDVLRVGFAGVAAVVVLLTPDDEARLRQDLRKASDPDYERRLTGQARQNVLFEAGMALAKHPDSTVFVQVGQVRPFTDVGGLHITRLDNTAESRQELATKLEAAGAAVDTGGTDWLSTGDFQ